MDPLQPSDSGQGTCRRGTWAWSPRQRLDGGLPGFVTLLARPGRGQDLHQPAGPDACCCRRPFPFFRPVKKFPHRNLLSRRQHVSVFSEQVPADPLSALIFPGPGYGFQPGSSTPKVCQKKHKINLLNCLTPSGALPIIEYSFPFFLRCSGLGAATKGTGDRNAAVRMSPESGAGIFLNVPAPRAATEKHPQPDLISREAGSPISIPRQSQDPWEAENG